MKQYKRKVLEQNGWKVGSTREFLGLSKEESDFIEMKLALSNHLKVKRHNRNYSQSDLAKLVKSSQSRVAKMERGDPSVSMDLLMHSLLTLGISRKELAKVIGA
jgi:DNA-binding XRE family transcriptional regulator